MDYASISKLNFSINFGFGEMPRYMLFHYYTYVASLAFIPPILFISFLHSIPVFYILKSERMFHPVYAISAILLVLVSSVYWSVAATVILYFFNFIYNDRSFSNKISLIFALSIHYISIPLSIFYFIFEKKARVKIITMTLIVFSACLYIYEEPYELCKFSETSQYNILDLEKLLLRIYYKIKEISLLLILLFIIWGLNDKVGRIKRNFSSATISVLIISFCVLNIVSISFYKQYNQETVGLYSYLFGHVNKYDSNLIQFAWAGMSINMDSCEIMSNRL
ncbi:hypothetical protein DYB14_08355 [Vibrio cholerae]|nr:hypothetical protein [Vibrio cholerae]EGR2401378.1 hypothetical protein [Vibrio cholerae]EGR2529564.1 hypothetical protein [Vibrio cholerae]